MTTTGWKESVGRWLFGRLSRNRMVQVSIWTEQMWRKTGSEAILRPFMLGNPRNRQHATVALVLPSPLVTSWEPEAHQEESI